MELAQVPRILANSRSVFTNQVGVNRHLNRIVARHLNSAWRKPFAEHSLSAFQEAQHWYDDGQGELILDSCCGVGESSCQLALDFPHAQVIGVDKSASRLARSAEPPDNCLLLRADVNDLWRLIHEAGWPVSRHYLLYPNPYPRRAQFSRRWHGSPAFPALLSLGGCLEVRSNWRLYIDEFVQALSLVEVATATEVYQPLKPLTPFERKYASSGQMLWRLTANVSHARLVNRNQESDD